MMGQSNILLAILACSLVCCMCSIRISIIFNERVSVSGAIAQPLRRRKEAPTVCQDFFAVLSNTWMERVAPRNTTGSVCSDLYHKYYYQLYDHNLQMQKMSSRLTIFTSWTPQELQSDPSCLTYFQTSNMTNIRVQQFDPETLLAQRGFSTEQIEWMKHWQDIPDIKFQHVATKLSDVFRVALQREYGMAYADLDLIHLMDDKRVYTAVPNVAVPVWQEEKGALEIQNSGFCFTSRQLDFLLAKMREVIQRKGSEQIAGNMYQYTELGPMLFMHSLQEMMTIHPVQLYYTAGSEFFKLKDIQKLHARHNNKFVWLHIDHAGRKRNWYRNKKQNYHEFVNMVREACPPPSITRILPSDTAS